MTTAKAYYHPKQPHGVANQINTYILDTDSVITGFGKHARVVAFHPSYDPEFGCVTLNARVDMHPNPSLPALPEPTPEQVLKAAKKDQGIRGKWKLLKRTEWELNGKLCIDFDFAR